MGQTYHLPPKGEAWRLIADEKEQKASENLLEN